MYQSVIGALIAIHALQIVAEHRRGLLRNKRAVRGRQGEGGVRRGNFRPLQCDLLFFPFSDAPCLCHLLIFFLS
jgi:hypothetical protein